MVERHYSNWSDITILDIAKLYVYGTINPPADYSERLRMDSEPGAVISVDMISHLSDGPGRYYSPDQFDLVKLFFESDIYLPDGLYSRDDMVSALGLFDFFTGEVAKDAIEIEFSQYGTDIFSSDFYLRAFVWGTTHPQISNATFSVVDGIRKIESLTIIEKEENFDFVGGDGTSIANAILAPLVDPYGIGKQVTIEMVGSGKTFVNYSEVEYAASTLITDSVSYSNLVGKLKLGALEGISFVNQLGSDPHTSYFENNKHIFYGSNNSDFIDLSPVTIAISLNSGIVIVGGEGVDNLLSGYFNDELYGGIGADYLSGGDGNDTLYSNNKANLDDNAADTLVGGLGADTYYVGDGDIIHDEDGDGLVHFDGIRLRGVGNNCENDGTGGGNGGAIVGVDGEIYTKTETGLQVEYNGKTIQIQDWKEGDLSIILDKKGADCGGDGGGGPPHDHGSPLVFDLDGDGLEITNLDEEYVYFDIDNDGIRERTAWVLPDDGLLALDRNGDGVINNANELFGYGETWSSALQQADLSDLLGQGIRYTSGFDRLRELDDNADDIIDASDASYANLRI